MKAIMKRQSRYSSAILRCGARAFICCLLAYGLTSRAEEPVTVLIGTPPPGAPVFAKGGELGLRTGGGFGIVINGSDMGTMLLKTCDLNTNGTADLVELKEVTSACFKLWDTNIDGNISGNELSTGLKDLFPAPPPGAIHAIRVINGIEVSVSPDDLPTPHGQITKHVRAGADSNKDGSLDLQEINGYLDASFSRWDKGSDGSLDASELNAAVGQLAMPDAP